MKLKASSFLLITVIACTAMVWVDISDPGTVSPGYAEKSAPAQPTKSGRFVVMSDIHAYACGDDGGPCQSTKSECKDPSEPVTLSCHSNLNDTDKCLFDSFMKDIACTQSNQTDFALFAGDWIAHEYAYPGLKVKKKGIIEVLSSRLQQQFGNNMLIIPALGNNDAYQGDYNIKPCLKPALTDCQDSSGTYLPDEGEFLQDAMELWKPLLKDAKELGTACYDNPSPGKDYFEESFLRGGYYSFSNSHISNNCTLVLNTVLLMNLHISGCPDCKPGKWGSWLGKGNGTEAASQQLLWLEERLKVASKHGKDVWLIYHVPPGADAWKSHKNTSATMMYSVNPWPNPPAGNSPTPKPPGKNPADGFLKLMADPTYQKVIKLAFAGHTHMDSFRVLFASGQPVSLVHITPSVTPQHHPGESGYQWFEYDVDSNGHTVLKDYHTRRLDLTKKTQTWTKEYSWKNQFGSPSWTYDETYLERVYDALSNPQNSGDEDLKSRYTNNFGEGQTTNIGDEYHWKYYVCAIGNLSETDYQAAIGNGSRQGDVCSPVSSGSNR